MKWPSNILDYWSQVTVVNMMSEKEIIGLSIYEFVIEISKDVEYGWFTDDPNP